MPAARSCLVGSLVWAFACSDSSRSTPPPAKSETPPTPTANAADGAAARPPAGAEAVGAAVDAKASPTQAADAATGEAGPRAAPTGTGGERAAEAGPSSTTPAPAPAARVPATGERQHDGVRVTKRVTLSRPRAAAGNGRSFGVGEIFWASGSPLTLDVIHLRPGEFEALETATEKAYVAAEAAGTLDEEGADPKLTSHPKLKTLRVGESLTLVGTTGLRTTKVGAFAAYSGASDGHLAVDLVPPVRSPKDALALRGAVHPDARLLEPEAAPPIPAVTAELDRVPTLISPEARTRAVESKVATIRAAAAGSQLVTVTIPRKDEDDDYEGFSGLLVVESGGRVHELVEPGERSHRMDALYLVDVDGDGIDEVLFQSDYFESSGYLYLAVWDGARYVNLQLSGDGG